MSEEVLQPEEQTTQQSSVSETALRLGSTQTYDHYRSILQTAGVHEGELHQLAYLVMRLTSGRVKPEEFLELMVNRLGVRPDTAVSMATSLATQVLLPMQDQLKINVQAFVQAWTGMGETGRPIAEHFVHEYVLALDGVDDTHEQQRYESIFLNYLTGRTTREQAIERFGRSVKTNGLGIEAQAADALLVTFDAAHEGKTFEFEVTETTQEIEEAPAEEIVEEPVADEVIANEVQDTDLPEVEEVIEEVAQDEELQANDSDATPIELAPEPEVVTPQAAPPVPTSTVPAKETAPVIDAFTPEDQKEVQSIEEARADLLNTSNLQDVTSVVTKICESPVFAFDEPLLSERCQKLVDSRVRGVRNAVQTRSKFEQPVDKGGLGVSGRRLADLMEAIESHVRAYEAAFAQHHQKQKQEAVAAEVAKMDKQAHAQAEEQHLSKKYAELTGRMPGEVVAPAAPAARRTSAKISAHHELQQQSGKIDADRVKEVIEKSSKPPKKRPQIRRPSMQEVVFEKRLAGPAEELRRMTLIDFRRLSADPTQAATKVQDKVELLEDQGHEQKVEAINAWRESPVNSLYVSLTREAVLSGVPVVEVLNQKRTAGEDVFSDAELEAVMKLNDTLRF